MGPPKLTLSNFMCYRADGLADGPAPLDLDGLHVVCLSGENGAGKSALLDAITWALWGEARMADDDLVAQGQAEMWVELEFRLGELDYRVRRARQRGGTGKRGGQAPGKSQLDLQVRNGAGWKALSESGVRETQAAINDVLRMSYQTFINASFLLQGRADEFTARTPSERKEVLAEILDLGEYEALALKARERARALADELRGLRGAMEQLAEEADKAPLWRDLVADAETKAESLSQRVAGAEAEASRADEARRALEQQAEQRKALLRRLDELRRERAEREGELKALRERIAQDEATLARGDTIRAGLAALAEARKELERLDGLRGEYQRLVGQRQELQGELKAALAELRAERDRAAQARDDLAEAAARREPLAAALAEAERRLAALRPAADERVARLEERQGVEARLARLNELRLRRGALVAQIEKRQDALVAAREEQGRLVRRLEGQLADEPAWQRGLAEARAAAGRLAEAEGRLAELRARERAEVDQVTALQAGYKAAHAEGEQLKRSRALLDGDARVCPVCRSDLGPDGVAGVHAHYDDELADLRRRYAAAKREADQGRARLEATRGEVAALDAGLPPLRAAAARAETLAGQLEQAAAWRAELERARAARADLEAQIRAKEFEPAAQAELAALEADLAGLGDPDELAQARAMLDERLAELDQRLQERGQIEGGLDHQREALRQAEAAASALPAAEARAAELAARVEAGDYAPEVRKRGREVEAAIADLGYSDQAREAAQASARALADWEREERELLLAEQRLGGDREGLGKSELLQRRADEELERLAREDALLAEALRGLPAALARADELRAGLEDARRALSAAQKDLGEKQAYLKRAEQAAAQLEEQRGQERALVERQGLFAELAEAFGKKGVQAMLIETAIPQIEDEANRLLGRMTDGQMHLSFEMQRDTKKGDTVETLEIKIADALGTRVYDAFSGGEAMRANFAVRIALSRLLARRAGARLETLVIDEGFGTLDALGRERMVEAITTVQDDFRRIIVITHIDELKERFPAQIEVTKTAAGSRWELR